MTNNICKIIFPAGSSMQSIYEQQVIEREIQFIGNLQNVFNFLNLQQIRKKYTFKEYLNKSCFTHFSATTVCGQG